MPETTEVKEIREVSIAAVPEIGQPAEHVVTETVTKTDDENQDEEGVAWLEERLNGLEATLHEMKMVLELYKDLLQQTTAENQSLKAMIQSQTETLTGLAATSILSTQTQQVSQTPEATPETEPANGAVVNPAVAISQPLPESHRARRRRI